MIPPGYHVDSFLVSLLSLCTWGPCPSPTYRPPHVLFWDCCLLARAAGVTRVTVERALEREGKGGGGGVGGPPSLAPPPLLWPICRRGARRAVTQQSGRRMRSLKHLKPHGRRSLVSSTGSRSAPGR